MWVFGRFPAKVGPRSLPNGPGLKNAAYINGNYPGGLILRQFGHLYKYTFVIIFGGPKSPQKPLPGARNRPLGPRNEVPEPSRTIPGSAYVKPSENRQEMASESVYKVEHLSKSGPNKPYLRRPLDQHLRRRLEGSSTRVYPTWTQNRKLRYIF